MDILGNYIDGRFVTPSRPDLELVCRSPADLSDVVGRFPVATSAVDEAVACATSAKRAWADAPQAERNAALMRIKAEIQKRADAFALAILREVGKPLWEAKIEVKAMLSKAEITVGEGLAWIAGFKPEGLAGECRFRPHGVLAVIGPFNFPGHLPNGHILPALAAGNCVVFKPSEVAPGVGQLYAEAIHAAGLPPGVFNMIQGERAVGERLSSIDGVSGILFTGSHAVGAAIQRSNADKPGKILALELGGKNCSIVLDDADLDKALYDILFSAYVTAGQRCSATSRALVHRTLVDRFAERMAKLVQGLNVGHPSKPDTFMGPVATAGGVKKFLDGCSLGEREGAEAILRAEPLALETEGHYVRPALHRIHEVRGNSSYQREELFGPDLAIYAIDDLAHGIALANAVDYGLCAAVFTRSQAAFESAANRIEAGVINWNAPTVGASGRLPFGGIKRSGNHRPAGVFSSLYCAYPVAITRGDAALDPKTIAPGIRWS